MALFGNNNCQVYACSHYTGNIYQSSKFFFFIWTDVRVQRYHNASIKHFTQILVDSNRKQVIVGVRWVFFVISSSGIRSKFWVYF